jgi:hypothetical protein
LDNSDKNKKNKDSLMGALCNVLNLRKRFIGGRRGSSGERNEGDEFLLIIFKRLYTWGMLA